MSYDWNEEQRRREADRVRKLTNEARELSTSELRRSLEWQYALADHADENMRHGDYHGANDKATIIRMELARRGERT